MSEKEFIDYYELMQLSPNADVETIERVFRHFAKKFHPDNAECADNDKFIKIVEAHRTLIDPETRAGYDVKYQNYWNSRWRIASDASDGSAFGEDHVTRERLLSLLYVQRRRDMNNPGLGNHEMARLLSTPLELVEFHLWYLKDKGFVERLHSGQYGITALGVDQVEQSHLRLSPDHLIEILNPAGNETGDRKYGNADLLVSSE